MSEWWMGVLIGALVGGTAGGSIGFLAAALLFANKKDR